MTTIIDLITIRLPDASLVAELRADLPHSRTDLGGAPVTISTETLRGLALLLDAYGAALTAMALPAPHLAWASAQGHAAGAGHALHVRMALADRHGAVQAPLVGGSLARLIVVADRHGAVLPPRPALCALVAVAGPAKATRWGLAPVDGAGAAGLALAALGASQADLLAHRHPRSSGRAARASLRKPLRTLAHLLYLIAYLLWLVAHRPRADRVPSSPTTSPRSQPRRPGLTPDRITPSPTSCAAHPSAHQSVPRRRPGGTGRDRRRAATLRALRQAARRGVWCPGRRMTTHRRR